MTICYATPTAILEYMDKVSKCLNLHKVEINLPSSDDIAYPTCQLTKDGVKPKSNKLNAFIRTKPKCSFSKIKAFFVPCPCGWP